MPARRPVPTDLDAVRRVHLEAFGRPGEAHPPPDDLAVKVRETLDAT